MGNCQLGECVHVWAEYAWGMQCFIQQGQEMEASDEKNQAVSPYTVPVT